MYVCVARYLVVHESMMQKECGRGAFGWVGVGRGLC